MVLVPLALLTQSQSAQKRAAREEERREAEARRKSRKTKEEVARDRAEEEDRRRLAARPKAFRQSGLSPEPISAPAIGFAVSPPLSEVAKQKPRRKVRSEILDEGEEAEREAAENHVTRVVTPQARAEADEAAARGLKRDTAIQAAIPQPNIPNPIVTFEGLGRTENVAAGFGNLSPPDTNGSVGPNHYVQQTNLLVRVWDKTGTPLTAPFKLSSLFTTLGGECAADDGDPIVLYDEMADRWMLSQFAFAGGGTAPPFHQCIAISKTSDPTGQYYIYDFITPGSEFPDYPHLGVWPDGYYMTVNQFTEPGDIFNGTGVYAFNRTKMLAGDPAATYVYFSLSLAAFPEAIGGMLPADMDGISPPPPGRPNVFAYFTSTDFGDPANGLRLFDFHADFTTPANSTFTERAESTYAAPLAVAAFSVVTPTTNNGRSAVPQPPPATSTSGLDAITDRLMFRLQYRNRGGFETLVTTHTVGAPASTTFGTFRAAPRYYELRSTAGGPYAVQEQATYAPADGVSRWMGSAAEDNQGNLAVGFSASSTTVFPGIRYAGRLATDPAGGLAQGEATIINGTGVQTSTGNRWGDYSALTLDPVDDCTFWYTTEYYTAAGQAASATGWQTRIGNFKFTQCTAPAKGTAHFTVTDCTSAANVANATVTIDGIAYGVSATNGTFDAPLAPGAHTYSVSKAGTTTATGNFSITDGNTTNVPVCLTGIPVIVANGASLTVDPNNNGAIDPGETVTVSFGVKNNGAGATTNLVGTLQATGGVTNPGPPASFGVVAANGGTAAQPIQFTADGSLTCGSTLTATLQLQDGPSNLGTVTYNFTLCPIIVVTATAGTTGPTSYQTLKAAFDAINAGTHQGAVTVSINASTNEGTTPATLNGSGAGSASYTSVLLRPVSDGVSVSGSPASGLGVIQLNGASNVTIDGDNPNTAGTNRNLTVRNTAASATTFGSVIRIALATTGATAANNDTFKNLVLLGNATGRNNSGGSAVGDAANTAFGIYASAGSAGATAAPTAVTAVNTTIGSPATATNLLIQNNSINTAGRAIATHGSATTVFSGLQIKDNVIGNPTTLAADQVYSDGIIVNGTGNGVVSGNTLYIEGFVSSSTSGANQAISIGAISANTTAATVEKNRVVRVHNNATDTWPAIGINMGGGNNHVVQNNFVTDILNNQANGNGGGGTTFGAYGIRASAGTGHKVYHNSVHLFGTLPGTSSTDLTAAFMIVNTGQTGMDVRNNVFSNQLTGGNPGNTSAQNTRHAVLFLPSGATSTMNLTLNNNAYFQGTVTTGPLSLLAKIGTTFGTGEFLAANFNAGATTPATNLRSYTSTLSAAGTNDNASRATTVAPVFVSNTDLHVPNGTSTPLESGGAAVGLNNDIDGQTRPGPAGSVNGGGTAPDLGADEFDGAPSAVFPLPLQIAVNDARRAEPAAGGVPMLFTLTLSAPAPGGGLTVSYATANGGANPATGGASCDGSADYVTASGTANVPANSQTATIPVTICADSDNAETDETLLLNISSPSSGTIADAQATGTITVAGPAGAFVISELRTSGPGGAGDDFVEFYNNSNSPLTVAASDASAGYGLYKMGATCNDTPLLIATIPSGTVIPARGHYLAVGSAYSLANYGGTGAAAGNVTLTSDIENDRDVAVFSTANAANISTANRLDAVGFGTNTGAVCDLLREGSNLPAVAGSTTEHSFFRKECDFVGGVGCLANGNPKDSGDNSADFMFADTQGTLLSGVPQRMGAPGPENLAAPIRRDNSGIGLPLLDTTGSASAPPNRARDFTMVSNGTFGTLIVRRRVTNNTGASVTRLRFRIVELTSFPSPGGGQADLRLLSSSDASVGPINDAATCAASGAGSPPCVVTVKGSTLEQAPGQPNGGGVNSTMSITLGTPLANGSSVNVGFVLGVQQTGTFRFYLVVEALP